MQYRITVPLLCLSLLLAACEVGKNYTPAPPSVPTQWNSLSADSHAEIDQEWWKHFHDALLDQFIGQALSGNLDLKIAQARINEARAARMTATNDLLPTVNTEASAERQANRIAFGNTPFDIAKPFNVFQAGFDASWELDLFGGKRRAIESATAELEAAEAARDAARVSLLAEVARTYVDIRHYQAQLAIAKDTIAADEKTASIAAERYKVGESPQFDVTQAQSQVSQAKSQMPYYQNLLSQAQLSMDMLLGEKPGATQALVAAAQPIPVGDKSLVLAAPAKVIANRPDIREAERKLAAATAQQSVAVAQFFPDISLSGFLGLLSSDAGNLLRTDSKSWDVGGNILWPILNYGKLSANLKTADAQKQEALLEYQKAIIAGLVDVERSVSAYTTEEEHRAALEETANLDLRAVTIARERYKEGLSSFLEVLDAERTLYTSQSQAASASAAASQNLMAVYKSLGGGWKENKAPAASP